MPDCKLMFPTAPRCGAKRAGLNLEDFWLHNFRSAYATRCLRNGMAIADVRAQLGHAPGSNTIWKYVQAARGAKRPAAVEKVSAQSPVLYSKPYSTSTVLIYRLIAYAA
jgi:hypothetical protein